MRGVEEVFWAMSKTADEADHGATHARSARECRPTGQTDPQAARANPRAARSIDAVQHKLHLGAGDESETVPFAEEIAGVRRGSRGRRGSIARPGEAKRDRCRGRAVLRQIRGLD